MSEIETECRYPDIVVQVKKRDTSQTLYSRVYYAVRKDLQDERNPHPYGEMFQFSQACIDEFDLCHNYIENSPLKKVIAFSEKWVELEYE
jgi:hypothetical protein